MVNASLPFLGGPFVVGRPQSYGVWLAVIRSIWLVSAWASLGGLSASDDCTVFEFRPTTPTRMKLHCKTTINHLSAKKNFKDQTTISPISQVKHLIK